MDTRSLACFLAVAEGRHFRKAALALHMTQPTLSQRIRVLEDEVGTPLFLRDRRHVALTAAGEAFLEPARAALVNARLAIRCAREAESGTVGRLRLGFTVIAFYGRLPAVVREFRAAYPEVAVELVERNSPALEAALVADEIDIGVLHPPLERRELTRHALPGERLLLALPASHPLAALAEIPIAQLSDEALLVAPRSIGPVFHDRLLALFEGQGVTPRIAQEVTPMTTLAGLVAAGVGIGFVTEGIARSGRSDVLFRPVTPEPPVLPLAAAWLGPRPNAAGQHFLEMIMGWDGKRGSALSG